MKIDKAELDAQLAENPGQAVAMVSVRAIDELSQMMIKAGVHDAASTSMVMGLCAWLTSVLDGKATEPGQSLVDAAKTIDEAVLQELDRCQHFVQKLHDRVKLAESRALVSEQHAAWYLRLRDGGTTLCAAKLHPNIEDLVVEGDALDFEMEDIDTENKNTVTPTSAD